jgi:exopolysaccharide biosynthesis polyprenyl glycosylphosphotransferase
MNPVPLFADRSWNTTALSMLLFALLIWYTFRLNEIGWSVTVLSGIGLVVAGRVLAGTLRRRGAFTEGVLILGTSPMAAKLIEEIEARPDGHFRLIGAVDDSPVGKRAPGVTPLLGRLDQFAQIVAATRPSRIVIAMADRRGRIPDQSLLESRFRGVVVEDAVDFFERVTGKLAIESLKPSSLILSGGFRHSDFMRSSMRRSLRRCLSCLAACVTLVLTSPLLLLVALAIRLDSRGPVFFVQQRVGRGGKPFGLVKFRTMREQTGVQTSEWVTDNTSRITRVGKWLRRFRLDELPQFFNVVQGDMGLVGPRPHPMSNYELFLERIPYYAFRSMVRPGITGWAQVRYGYANDLEEETEKMRYDFYYIKHRSIELDVRILFETARVLLFDRRSHQAAKSRVAAPASAWSGIGSAS